MHEAKVGTQTFSQLAVAPYFWAGFSPLGIPEIFAITHT